MLEFAYMGNSRADMYDKSWAIKAWLYSEERSTITFDLIPSKYFIGKPDGAIDLEPLFVMGKFEVAFRCEPFAYGGEQQASFVADAVTVNNSGTAETPPVITATFTAAASEWKVTLGSKYVRVVRDFLVGDLLEINCATGAVLVNGVRSMFFLDWQNSEFFALLPGPNTLTITPAAVCTATVSFKPRWL